MTRTLVFLTAVMISFLAARPATAAPAAPGIGDQLSLSVTNKYGDVLANPTVSQILGDGLVLQSGTMAMKVKYDDLPPDIRQKYQPLAAGVMQKEEKARTRPTPPTWLTPGSCRPNRRRTWRCSRHRKRN